MRLNRSTLTHPSRAGAVATALACLSLAAPGWAQMVSYECDSFPEEEGWERIIRPYSPERWLDDGWLYFKSETLLENPCGGEDEFYRWELGEWAGAPRFRLEGRFITDGPSSELAAVAPVSLVASGASGIRFHTSVARDESRFIWDPPSHFFSIEPDAPHVFKVEIYGPYWFEWSIDGVVHDYGSWGRQYPTEDSVVQWGVRAFCFDNVSAFDFIRFGVPDDEPLIDCDAVRKLKARCREGRGGEGRIVAKVRTRLDEGTELTLTNNGDHRVMRVKPNGKAKAKYKRQTGEHTLLLLNCPAISQEVACE